MFKTFLWFPFFQSINIVFIGPEIDVNTMQSYTFHNRNLTIRCVKGLYHEYVLHKDYTIPFVACCFQSGLFDEEYKIHWEPTVKYLQNHRVYTSKIHIFIPWWESHSFHMHRWRGICKKQGLFTKLEVEHCVGRKECL